ncbi:MAG: short-chain fatty acid transporter [Myxococcota bacterium]
MKRFGQKLSDLSERFVPEPFVLALLLTVFTLIVGVVFGEAVNSLPVGERFAALADGFYADFYGTGLMKFALQMCIVLITGHALALSEPVQALISRFTRFAQGPKAAVVVVSVVACLASLIQWGLGAIAGAFMAREMGRSFAEQGKPVHYPLLGAAGYAGFLVWHGGFSGSAPLKVAENGHFLEDTIGVIPITDTLLSPLNLVVIGSLLVVIPFLFWSLMPTDESEMTLPPFPRGDQSERVGDDEDYQGVVGFLEKTRALNVLVGGLLVAMLVYFFAVHGIEGWNLDSINLLFLTLGILLHPSPSSYVAAIVDGVKGAGGIILQFPFYFGILGLLKASGLIDQVAQFFVGISTAQTFPIFTFLSGGIVNFLVPSGGGQWAVQGPVMMGAVRELGVSAEKVIMALSYGDAWSNMLQPFWALPLLGIMNLRAKDIIGYTALVMFITGPLIMLLLFLF